MRPPTSATAARPPALCVSAGSLPPSGGRVRAIRWRPPIAPVRSPPPSAAASRWSADGLPAWGSCRPRPAWSARATAASTRQPPTPTATPWARPATPAWRLPARRQPGGSAGGSCANDIPWPLPNPPGGPPVLTSFPAAQGRALPTGINLHVVAVCYPPGKTPNVRLLLGPAHSPGRPTKSNCRRAPHGPPQLLAVPPTRGLDTTPTATLNSRHACAPAQTSTGRATFVLVSTNQTVDAARRHNLANARPVKPSKLLWCVLAVAALVRDC